MQGYFGDGLGSGQGGHTIHWHNDNGNIKIIEGQSHHEYDWDEAMDHYKFNDGACFRTRLDNCEPNWDGLAEDGVIGINNAGRRYVKGTVHPDASYEWYDVYNRF